MPETIHPQGYDNDLGWIQIFEQVIDREEVQLAVLQNLVLGYIANRAVDLILQRGNLHDEKEVFAQTLLHLQVLGVDPTSVVSFEGDNLSEWKYNIHLFDSQNINPDLAKAAKLFSGTAREDLTKVLFDLGQVNNAQSLENEELSTTLLDKIRDAIDADQLIMSKDQAKSHPNRIRLTDIGSKLARLYIAATIIEAERAA
ncbi:MAG TPA: hypothetical protein ENI23_04710 [bacterium]|nr:hypothetical protein [bacterium]